MVVVNIVFILALGTTFTRLSHVPVVVMLVVFHYTSSCALQSLCSNLRFNIPSSSLVTLETFISVIVFLCAM